MTDQINKKKIIDLLQAKIDGAQTGGFLGIRFSEIARQTGIPEDVLETELLDMTHHDGTVIRIGHPNFRQDEFALDKNHRRPESA